MNYHNTTNKFLGKIKCASCGAVYGAKVWHSTSRYRKVIYQCNNKFDKGKTKCKTPHFEEEEIKLAFIKAYNSLGIKKEVVCETCDMIVNDLKNSKSLDDEIIEFKADLDIVSEKANKMVTENASKVQSQEEYAKKYNALCERYDSYKKKIDDLTNEKTKRAVKVQSIIGFKDNLQKQNEDIKEWDRALWNSSIDEALVHADGTIEFKFYNGMSIIEEIGK